MSSRETGRRPDSLDRDNSITDDHLVRIGGIGLSIDLFWDVFERAAIEATMFAAVGFLIGGLDDLLVDALFFCRAAGRRLAGRSAPLLDDLPASTLRIAVFVPAWQEAGVIGQMLRTALARWPDAGLRIYVGGYPNDPDTLAAVNSVAAADARVRLVVNPRAGPTTKADGLNTLWHALLADERREGAFDAIALHDAEDVVHRGEPAVFAYYLAQAEAVQLPVLPLPSRRSRFVAGTYIDEFAEAHAKQLVVRGAIGAGMPFAGVGCAIRRDVVERIAAMRGGDPFDADSLTEDYELGLTVAATSGQVVMARVREGVGRPVVAVREYFPETLPAAVRQKARWLIGIALAGWDRTGWGRSRDLADHWMRLRDRRAPLAAFCVLTAYFALLMWGIIWFAERLGWLDPLPLAPWLATILTLNLAMLGWRTLMRMIFTGRVYGFAQALLSVPRIFVGNLIAIAAAREALDRYAAMLRGAPPRWDKTDHRFPAPAELAG